MTEREKYLLIQGIIKLLDNATTVYEQLYCKPAKDEITKYIEELNSLKNKIALNKI